MIFSNDLMNHEWHSYSNENDLSRTKVLQIGCSQNIQSSFRNAVAEGLEGGEETGEVENEAFDAAVQRSSEKNIIGDECFFERISEKEIHIEASIEGKREGQEEKDALKGQEETRWFLAIFNVFSWNFSDF